MEHTSQTSVCLALCQGKYNNDTKSPPNAQKHLRVPDIGGMFQAFHH